MNTEADGLMNRRGNLDTVAVNEPEDVALAWDSIDRRVHEQNVIRLRRRIFKATRECDWATVRSLQRLMLGEGLSCRWRRIGDHSVFDAP